MVKIKRKVEKNLPQLIEWAWDNDITNKEYICNEFQKKSVIFNLSGWAEFSDEFSYNPEDTFTVEKEEEITEDTELFLVERFTDSEGNICYQRHRKQSIKNNIKNNPSYFKTTHIYTEVNEELILIWDKYKGLVE